MTLDLDMSPEVQATKEKIHKLVFIKIQNVFLRQGKLPKE